MKYTQSNVCIQLVESMTGELPSDMVAKFNLGNDGGDHSKPALSDLYSVHQTVHEYG